MALIGSDENKIQRAKTRLLLVLWGVTKLKESLSDTDKKKNELPTKGDLKLTRAGEKSADYDEIFEALEADGAIALTRQKSGKIKNVTLTQVGYGLLGDWLRSPDFEFEGTQIGAKLGNYLVKWIAHVPNAPVFAVSAPKISSYDEFKAVALETYDQINFEFNHNNFVPIYKIRRSIGELVTRSEFNEWLINMQADDILLLQESGVEDSSPDKLQDSVSTPISGLRCYATKKIK